MKPAPFKPGLYHHLPELAYHADMLVPGGSFSSTMGKQILKSPAHLRYYLDSPRQEKAAFDFGHVVHNGVLGVGLEVVVLDFPDWRTNAAKDARKAAYAAGDIPMLPPEYATAQAAVKAVKEHPLAGPLFEGGHPEVSAFAQDPVTGLWLRARVDYAHSGRLVDLKTTNDGAPREFSRSASKFGYRLQDAFYRYVWELATGEPIEQFLFVTVEKSAPHLVDVHAGDDLWREFGKMDVRRAIDTYARALETDEWPGRPPIINELSSPPWDDPIDYDDEEGIIP